MAHTPGKWEACDVGDYSDYDGRCRVILGDNLRIAVVLGCHDESKANARLIAAAPDLLEALEMADAALRGANMNMAVMQRKIEAAIAKAKGEA